MTSEEKDIFRIKKYPKGWVVEIKKLNWWGKERWTHFISVAGIETEPWHFSTYESALTGLQDEVKYHVFRNQRKYNN